jgi:hypothetical protein
LRQYLNKDHAFRHKLVTTQRRGWIDDNFGLSTGEPFAVTGWRDFAAFFGASNTVAGSDWFGTLTSNSYLWGYGCGPGTYTSCSGVGNTANFAASDPQVVFTMFFGSYFGDWDSQDNFLRAALATPTYTLTSVWSGRPYWQFHHMGLGETIGYSTLASQNNLGVSQGGYDFNADNGFVHIALMGDPTLRMHMVAPPSALLVSSNGSGGASVSWNASPDTVLGYYVYSAPTAAGPFTRLTSSLLTVTNYTDPVVSTNVYMVRAVKLEVSGSGSYSNASQGIFQSLDGTAGAPGIILFQPTNTTTFGAWPAIQINADTFDPANSVTNHWPDERAAALPPSVEQRARRHLCPDRPCAVQQRMGHELECGDGAGGQRAGGHGEYDHVALPHDRRRLPDLWQRVDLHRHGHRQLNHAGRECDFQGWPNHIGHGVAGRRSFTQRHGNLHLPDEPQCDWIAALHCRLLSGRKHA